MRFSRPGLCCPQLHLGARLVPVIALATVLFPGGGAFGQLAPCDSLGIAATDVPGGCIAKTLAEQIGAGHGDAFTPGSAVYLIARDPARSIRRGRQLFQRKFSGDEGLGPRVSPDSSGDVTTTRALGAGLADSCAACHGRPRGSAGHGGDVATFPDSRDAPHLFGLGLIEMLADEITGDLRRIRQEAVDEAAASGTTITRALESKGLDYGEVIAHADGTVDPSQVEGIDPDLRVRPFFSQGGTISMREFIVGALNDEMGLQAWDPVLCAATDPVAPAAATSPSGFLFDPGEDDFNRPPVCDAATDGDGDGIVDEIDPAVVDHLEFYLLNYFKPGQYMVFRPAGQGLDLMASIGCTSCHVQNLTLDRDRRVADVETTFDPARGIYNDLFAVETLLFSVVDDGEEYPLLVPNEEPFVVRNVFTDLKRHDLGPAFEERDWDGSRIIEHLTEPLWGVATSAPYGHDGRSINLDAVIRRHGGEAESSRLAYEALSGRDRAMIQLFLEGLVLFPPDDTASALDPGDPNGDPQDPSSHGRIDLSVLFQIVSEGPE